MNKYTIGVDIGGTKCSAVLGKGYISDNDLEGFILDKVCFPTEALKGADYTIQRIIRAIQDLMERNLIASEAVVGIGISCGGPVSYTHLESFQYHKNMVDLI